MQDTHWWGLTPLQRCSQCILQPQPTGQSCMWDDLTNSNYYNTTTLLKCKTLIKILKRKCLYRNEGVCVHIGAHKIKWNTIYLWGNVPLVMTSFYKTCHLYLMKAFSIVSYKLFKCIQLVHCANGTQCQHPTDSRNQHLHFTIHLEKEFLHLFPKNSWCLSCRKGQIIQQKY